MRRGQAAMEFLMTYGWAIIAAIIVIGVLAIYFKPTPTPIIPESLCSNESITLYEDIPFPIHLFCGAFEANNTKECMDRLSANCLKSGGTLWSDPRFSFTQYCMLKKGMVLCQ
jgi:hypothetical protein